MPTNTAPTRSRPVQDDETLRIKDAERVLAQLDMNGDCWKWTGSLNPDGYGVFYLGSERVTAHRWFYELIVGPIPTGLVIDHLCRNRACSRPSHLEPVTAKENILRGVGPTAINAAKTHCPKGHEYTVGNTGAGARGSRYCRACHRARARVANARSRESRREGRRLCSVCGLPFAIKADGTVYRHTGLTAEAVSTGELELCPGAGQPSAAP